MKSNNNRIKLAKDWFLIGQDELNFARAGLDDFDAFYSQICFLCQQSAEKYLKGFLVYHNTEFPKIHDLVELIRLCSKKNKSIRAFLDDAAILSQYYLISRYPPGYKQAGRIEAEQALLIADKIQKFVLEYTSKTHARVS